VGKFEDSTSSFKLDLFCVSECFPFVSHRNLFVFVIWTTNIVPSRVPQVCAVFSLTNLKARDSLQRVGATKKSLRCGPHSNYLRQYALGSNFLVLGSLFSSRSERVANKKERGGSDCWGVQMSLSGQGRVRVTPTTDPFCLSPKLVVVDLS
jgi:hypothetical protein